MKIAAVIMGLLLGIPSSIQAQGTKLVAGVSVPLQTTVENTTLYLNGAGIREKWWIDLYVGALYVPQVTRNAQLLIQQDKPMIMRLHIVSSLVTRDRMMESIEEGFQKALDGNTGPYQKRIEQLKSFFTKELHKNDVVELRYLPKVGVKVFLNETYLGTISGLDFKQALFSIWLGDNPVDEDLKQNLLGYED